MHVLGKGCFAGGGFLYLLKFYNFFVLNYIFCSIYFFSFVHLCSKIYFLVYFIYISLPPMWQLQVGIYVYVYSRFYNFFVLNYIFCSIYFFPLVHLCSKIYFLVLFSKYQSTHVTAQVAAQSVAAAAAAQRDGQCPDQAASRGRCSLPDRPPGATSTAGGLGRLLGTRT